MPNCDRRAFLDHITCFARRWCSHLSTGEKKLASNVQAMVSLGPVRRRINPRYINGLRAREGEPFDESETVKP